MKKNFTLLFSLLALVSAGQTMAKTLPIARIAPKSMAAGLARNVANANYSQIAATSATSNATAIAKNTLDTIGNTKNTSSVDNTTDLSARESTIQITPQDVITTITPNGANSAAININNRTNNMVATNFTDAVAATSTQAGAALTLGKDYTDQAIAVTSGVTSGVVDSTMTNTSSLVNNKSAALTQPTLQTMTTADTANTQLIPNTGISTTTPTGSSTPITTTTTVPVSSANLAVQESNTDNASINTAKTISNAKAAARTLNKSILKSLANSGPVTIYNTTNQGTGTVASGDTNGTTGSTATNTLTTYSANGYTTAVTPPAPTTPPAEAGSEEIPVP